MKYFIVLLSFFAVLSSAQAADSVRFCRPTSTLSALPYIADAKGFFEQEGVDVTFVTAANGKICQDALLGGSADMMSTGSDVFIYLAPNNPKFSILATLQRNPDVGVFVRKDHGILKPEDLKGKTVAWLPGTAPYFYALRFLEKHNLSISDIKWQAMQPPAMMQGLISGSIDAFIMWEPWGSNAMAQLGDKGLVLRDKDGYRFPAILLSTNQILKDKPQVAVKVLRALIKAEEDLAAHPAEDRAILAKDLAMDDTILAKLWPDYDNHVRLDNETLTIMAKSFAYLQKADDNFKDKPVPDFKKFIDSSVLKSIDPKRVDIK